MVNCVADFINSDFINTDRPAVIFFDGIKSINNPKKNMSFNELFLFSKKSQALLKNMGLEKGDTVLLFEKPVPDLYGFIIGALGLGVKLLVVEPWMPGKHFDSILKKHRPKALMAGTLGRIVLKKSVEIKKVANRFSMDDVRSINSTDEFHLEDLEEGSPALVS